MRVLLERMMEVRRRKAREGVRRKRIRVRVRRRKLRSRRRNRTLRARKEKKWKRDWGRKLRPRSSADGDGDASKV